ncbi:hypothetical protein ACHAXM_005824 [Skeletonema potamos]
MHVNSSNKHNCIMVYHTPAAALLSKSSIAISLNMQSYIHNGSVESMMQQCNDHHLNSGCSSRTLKGRWEPPPRYTSLFPYQQQQQQQHENNLNISGNCGQRVREQKRQQQKNEYRHPSKNDAGYETPNNTKKIISPDETATMPMEAEVPKLDPNNPEHARRIRQRRRQVLFGKNTIGYEEFVKQIPKHKRKFKSLDHPQTPDYLADIPTKRWQGQINAWRRSLHKFDPPDLACRQSKASDTKITLAPRPCVTDKDKVQEEIAQAKASGLQVAFDSMNVGKVAGLFSLKVAAEDDVDDNNEHEKDSSKAGDELFDEEAAYQTSMNDSGFLEQGFESDSDDDLL